MTTRTVHGIVTKIEATRLVESTTFADTDPQYMPAEITVTARCGTTDITYTWPDTHTHPRIGDPARFTIDPTEDA